MKIGININCYDRLPIGEQIALMKENGFTACFTDPMHPGYDCEIEHLQWAGIEVDFLHAPFGGINRIWGEGGEEMLRELTDCVNTAARHKIPAIVVHLSSGNNPPKICDRGIRRFEKLMEEADKKGVTVAYENQRKISSLAMMLEFYPNAGFCWDAGHEGCFTPGKQFMPLFGDRLTCLHLHDNNGIFNGDDHLIPGDGTLDFDRVARQIAQSGFSGTVMLEVLRENSHRYDDLSPAEYYRRAGAAARRLEEKIHAYRIR